MSHNLVLGWVRARAGSMNVQLDSLARRLHLVQLTAVPAGKQQPQHLSPIASAPSGRTPATRGEQPLPAR